jgi:hypothetical protein
MAFILNSARLLPPNVFGEEIGSQIPFSFVGRRTRLEGERAKATPSRTAARTVLSSRLLLQISADFFEKIEHAQNKWVGIFSQP